MTGLPPNPTKWDDLSIRIASSVAMTVIGAVGVILGDVWFQMLVVFVSAVMVWELWMMIRPTEPTKGMLLAALVASVMSGQLAYDSQWGLLLFLVAPLIGATQLRTEIKTFFVFALGIQLAGWGLVHFRADYGFTWLLWLMSVVIVTDVFGYFAGKAFGGPKFWPRYSPKKTWSGTAAGWVGAGLVGFGFWSAGFGTAALLWASPLVAFAGQLGDIAESAIKRRAGVKDSSNLIPGHGGLLDRFDALAFAGIVTVLISIMAPLFPLLKG